MSMHLGFNEHSLGHVYETTELTVFFGDKTSSREAVSEHFPDYRLSILKQTHSDRVVFAPFADPPPDADAQITTERKLALCIRTADCMPVVIHCPDVKAVAAIHAGWRGIENGIILKTAEKIKELGGSLSRARAWIGPHICSASFEVGRDVAAKLEARFEAVRGHSPAATCRLAHDDAEKARIDLLAIARAQLTASGIESDRTLELATDTFASSAHESFRRDRDKAGRQISFVALK